MDYAQQFQNAKVLVCDDDPTHNVLMQEVLEAEGFQVILASDGKEAIELYYSHSPDIILLDVAMPQKNGFGVCKEVRSTPCGKELPILMITSAGDVESISLAFNVGATDFLPKPIKWQLIAHRVAYMLHSSYAIEELKSNQNKLTYLAYFDALTGLPNKHNLQEFIRNNFFNSNIEKQSIALIHIRLGFLNSPYSSLGKKVADEFIKVITERLHFILSQHGHIDEYENSIRLARTSDDEFSLCWLDCHDTSLLEELISKLLQHLKKSVVLDDYQFEVEPKVGVACFPETAKSVEQLMTNSSIASFNAMNHGCHFYSLKDDLYTKESLNLEQQLRLALSAGKLAISFKPIIDISTSKVAAKHALLVWNNPNQGKVSIDPIKQTLGNHSLLIDIEMMGLALVFDYLSQQQNNNKIVFSVSKETCLSDEFSGFMSKMIIEQPNAIKCLELEVKHELLSTLQDKELCVLKMFRQNGGAVIVANILMASDMCRWIELNLNDQFKLSPNMLLTPKNRAVSQVVLTMAKSLNYKVIVDGEVDYLPIEQFKSLGCDFLYSRITTTNKALINS